MTTNHTTSCRGFFFLVFSNHSILSRPNNELRITICFLFTEFMLCTHWFDVFIFFIACNRMTHLLPTWMGRQHKFFCICTMSVFWNYIITTKFVLLCEQVYKNKQTMSKLKACDLFEIHENLRFFFHGNICWTAYKY